MRGLGAEALTVKGVEIFYLNNTAVGDGSACRADIRAVGKHRLYFGNGVLVITDAPLGIVKNGLVHVGDDGYDLLGLKTADLVSHKEAYNAAELVRVKSGEGEGKVFVAGMSVSRSLSRDIISLVLSVGVDGLEIIRLDHNVNAAGNKKSQSAVIAAGVLTVIVGVIRSRAVVAAKLACNYPAVKEALKAVESVGKSIACRRGVNAISAVKHEVVSVSGYKLVTDIKDVLLLLAIGIKVDDLYLTALILAKSVAVKLSLLVITGKGYPFLKVEGAESRAKVIRPVSRSALLGIKSGVAEVCILICNVGHIRLKLVIRVLVQEIEVVEISVLALGSLETEVVLFLLVTDSNIKDITALKIGINHGSVAVVSLAVGNRRLFSAAGSVTRKGGKNEAEHCVCHYESGKHCGGYYDGKIFLVHLLFSYLYHLPLLLTNIFCVRQPQFQRCPQKGR